MRKIAPLTIVISIFAAIVSSPSFAVDQNKYIWPLALNTLEQQQGPLLGYGASIVDDFTQGPGAAEAFSFISVAGNMQPLCTGFTDPVCLAEIKAGRGSWWSNIALAPCKTVNQLSACIEVVRIEDTNGTYRDLKLKKIIPGNTWAADSAIGLPEGSAPGLWVDPKETDPNKGYLVSASSAVAPDSNSSKVSGVILYSFQSSISPYEMILEPNTRGRSVTLINGIRKVVGGGGEHCIWADTGECGVQSEFAPEKRLQLVLHLPTHISSWLLGRMSDPEIVVERLSKTSNILKDISRVTISAESVEIPMIAATVNLSELNAAQKKYFTDPEKNLGNPDFPNNLHGYVTGGIASSYDSAFEMYELLKKQWPQNAQLMYPRWSVRSLTGNTPKFAKCTDAAPGKFQGVVTTNASIYQGEPPSFDGDSFDYKVAGVHKKTNGEVFQGSYDLVLDSKFARCLYKFTTAPIKASISITNADGNASVATSTFTEKDGWVKLSANGFTFSSPKISIKLSQDKSGSAATSTAKPIAKKTTITCVQGITSKKVTAVNPKCPAGYKKK
jgi:hypothetical protein